MGILKDRHPLRNPDVGQEIPGRANKPALSRPRVYRRLMALAAECEAGSCGVRDPVRGADAVRRRDAQGRDRAVELALSMDFLTNVRIA